jgi:hypothetical protein
MLEELQRTVHAAETMVPGRRRGAKTARTWHQSLLRSAVEGDALGVQHSRRNILFLEIILRYSLIGIIIGSTFRGSGVNFSLQRTLVVLQIVEWLQQR